MTISGNFERFRCFKFKTNISEKINFVQKKVEYRLLLEKTKTENATFPYKNTVPDTNVQTNKMGKTKWAYYKEQVLSVTTLFF